MRSWFEIAFAEASDQGGRCGRCCRSRAVTEVWKRVASPVMAQLDAREADIGGGSLVRRRLAGA